MGFCRRCGDIVAGERCHCGGASVAPVVSWKHSSTSVTNQDRWSKTYVSSAKSISPALERTPGSTGAVASALNSLPSSKSNSVKRFPRPLSFSSAPSRQLKSGVSDHINSATSNVTRPPSPLKISTTMTDTENDILPSFLPNEPTLSKVYGSLLQPTESLPLHSCARCSSVFPPDATIYPNPSQLNTSSFLCRNCFTVSGGSKGTCPVCSRPVLILKSEGGFVQSGGQYWHKRCYNCAGCFKNIGDAPMVDLLGRPSCVECFDNCLKGPTTPKKPRTSNSNSPNASNPGGLNPNFGRKSRESSPAIEELEQRLGLLKSQQGSPVHLDNNRNLPVRPDTLTGRASSSDTLPLYKTQDVLGETLFNPSGRELSVSPSGRLTSGFTYLFTYLSLVGHKFSKKASESIRVFDNWSLLEGRLEMSLPKSFIDQLGFSNISTHFFSGTTDPIGSIGPKRTTKSNSVSSSPGLFSSLSGLSLSATSCGKCTKPIPNSCEGGQFITVPGTDENAMPQLYHAECFKCATCDKSFSDAKKGQVSFVRTDAGPCHPQCAPANHFVIRRSVSTKSLHSLKSMDPPPNTSPLGLKRVDDALSASADAQRLPSIQRSPSKPVFNSFGGQNSCPGCQKPVSLMERGVVPGPQGTRWHALCLVCGGRKETTRAFLLGRNREDRKGEPGCGKRLDSAAKTEGEGRLLLGSGGSPTRPPLVPAFTGSGSPTKVAPQFTDIARQMTGLGGSDAVLRQLTGGGLSPTRSISPTKQLGMMGASGHIRPRPRSVIGIRGTKSVDEGRGMYLVRQFTGATINGGTS
ncbi:hypothetical protein CPB84DRAFT_1671124 [Gymnopilus junonius]|uniref:LIM zinc-binding domain-containing protein n=1 Tax=Gymnopilus junonius TaxID=109634 RepID=A0A9P5P032_GYMJU|nr:hypothetical protein CPB84DRAFT_1671124 [Gymnopilus junonius]